MPRYPIIAVAFATGAIGAAREVDLPTVAASLTWSPLVALEPRPSRCGIPSMRQIRDATNSAAATVQVTGPVTA